MLCRTCRVSVHPQTKPMKCNSLLCSRNRRWPSQLSQTAQELGQIPKFQGYRKQKGAREAPAPPCPCLPPRGLQLCLFTARRQPQCTALSPPPSLGAPSHRVGNWKLQGLGSPIHLAFILSFGLRPNFLWTTAHCLQQQLAETG